MENRKENIRKLCLRITNNTYAFRPIKEILPDDFVNQNIQSYVKMFAKLPADLEPFRIMVENVLKDYQTSSTPINQYRMVWLGRVLKTIYLGKEDDFYAAGSWEDDVDLVAICSKMN